MQVLYNQFSLFIRGLGGFGGDKGPKPENSDPPTRPPDVVQREQTVDNQALMYVNCDACSTESSGTCARACVYLCVTAAHMRSYPCVCTCFMSDMQLPPDG